MTDPTSNEWGIDDDPETVDDSLGASVEADDLEPYDLTADDDDQGEGDH